MCQDETVTRILPRRGFPSLHAIFQFSPPSMLVLRLL
jgi:hypothetical protein